MKKMSFTNLSYRNLNSLFGRAAFLMLFAWCFSMNAAYAQDAVPVERMPTDSIANVVADITVCDGENAYEFRDDDSGDGALYSDFAYNGDGELTINARRDTTTFCPNDEWSRVEVIFTEFSLAPGDFLVAWDGNLDALRANNGSAPFIDAATGEGVSEAFGGWINANCDPAVNPSGCITFTFQTFADNNKGTGWSAWVACNDRGVALKAADDLWASADCQDEDGAAPVAEVNITVTDLDGMCTGATDLIDVVITDAQGQTCLDVRANAGDALGALEFGVGTYRIVQTLVSDDEKEDVSYLYVAGPSLTCNDEVNVSLGGGCKVILDADNLLEAPCDTNSGVSYEIEIKIGDKTITSTDKLGNITISKEDLGADVCEGTQLTATITRTFDYSNAGLACEPADVEESCKVLINIKDDTAPIFEEGARVDSLIACDNDDIEDILEDPAVIDNCGLEGVTSVKALQTPDRCTNPQVYYVTWTATDNCGKEASRVDTVRVFRPTVVVEAPKVEADCEDREAGIDPIIAMKNNRPGFEIGRILEGDTINKDTVRLSEDIYICNYILTKREVETPADCGKKVFVTWSLVDWCDPVAPSTINTQLIHFTDTEEPEIEDAHLVSYDDAKENPTALPHFKCYLDKSPLPVVGASDNCGEATVEMIAVEQKGEGDTWTKIADNLGAAIAGELLVCDTFRVIYEASDLCHTQTKTDLDTSYIVVIDNTKPSAVAVDQLNISLPNEWGARVCYEDIDAGSYDACGIATREIRIKGKYTNPDAGWANCIDIGCDYIKTPLQIELRITDEKGNRNIAWTDIYLEDKIKPYCEAPADARDYCDNFHNGELGTPTDVWAPVDADLQAIYDRYFGAFVCEDNLKTEVCGDLDEEQEYQLREWPCGEIEIRRRHRATDWSGNISDYVFQNITIEYRAGWSFTVPADAEGTCETAPEGNGLVINNGACDLLGYEVTDKRFDVPGDACYKIERTYHIINWCKYQAGQDPVEIARVEGEHKEVAEDKKRLITKETKTKGILLMYKS